MNCMRCTLRLRRGLLGHARVLTCAFACVLMLALGSQRAIGMDLPSYNLDSLAFMAHDIVSGRIVSVRAGVVEVKIEVIYAGKLRAGSDISVDLPSFFFEIPRSDGKGSAPGPGDRLIFFLIKGRPGLFFHPPPGSYVLVSSGLKLIEGHRVYGFYQLTNPGGYLGGPNAPFGKKGSQTLKRFVASLQQSIKRVQTTKTFFETPPNRKQIPRLLSMLKRRSALDGGNIGPEDAIEDAAAERLALFRDCPSAILPAITYASHIGFQASVALPSALATPAGRDLWLAWLGDPKTPMRVKEALAAGASALGVNYWMYGSYGGPVLKQGAARGRRVTRSVNGNYMARLATLALRLRRNKPFFQWLMGQWDFLIRCNTGVPLGLPVASVRSDMTHAYLILARREKAGVNRWQKTAINMVLRDMAAFLFCCDNSGNEANRPSYDLDSLAFLAHDIVYGRIVAIHDDDAVVKIQTVYYGNLREGAEIKVATCSAYRVADRKYATKGFKTIPSRRTPTIMLGLRPLQPGVNVFLFLTPIKYRSRCIFNLPAGTLVELPSGLGPALEHFVSAHSPPLFSVPEGALVPVPSGVQVVMAGRVRRFFFRSEGHKYYLANPTSFGEHSWPTVHAFVGALKRSLQRVGPVRTDFKSAPQAKLTPRLLALLRSRESVQRWNGGYADSMAWAATRDIARSHNPQAIAGALSSPHLWKAVEGHARAFFFKLATPTGRNLCLSVLGDPKAPGDTRYWIAAYFSTLGMQFWRDGTGNTVVHAEHKPAKPSEKHRANGHYMERVARLTLRIRDDKREFEPLVRSWNELIQSYTATPVATKDGGVRRDMERADAILKSAKRGGVLNVWQSTSVKKLRRSIAAFLRE